MDLEALRTELVEGAGRLSRLRLLSQEQRRLAAASALYWRQAPASELLALASHLPGSADLPAAGTPEEVLAAARSMRDRASRVALRHGVIPCSWLAYAISADIDLLPLVEE